MTDTSQFQWTSAARSDVGRVRQKNEDSCLDQAGRGVWAVADGMGGHARGELASQMVVAALDALPAPLSLRDLVEDARESLQAVNRQLLIEAVNQGVQVIGSTVVLLLAYERHAVCLWAGDSRIYRYRDGTLQQLTRDHSQLEELKARGELSEEDALHFTGYNLITRAIGATDRLELEEVTVEVADDDVFLLCSDGLSNEVGEQEIADALADGDCDEAADTLLKLALQRGGRDNISVVVVAAHDARSNDATVLNPVL